MGTIDENTRDYLTIAEFTTPTFYALPKIHKSLVKPPGRPIVAGIGSLTEKASTLVDKHLRPHVEGLPSYLKDTRHLLQAIEGLSIESGSLLVSLDVEAIYSSIPHDKGIVAVEEFIKERKM